MILAAVADEASGSTFDTVMGHVAQGFEALGAGILVLGVIWSFVLGAIAWRRSGQSAQAYLVLRQAFGGTLLLGLIVVIRTFLSFSLETEIEGVAPWRRATASGAGTIRRATASALKSEPPP